MDFSTILNTRKTIRSFTGEAVSEDVLSKILSAANASPVGSGAYDSVHLTVVKSKKLLEKIEKNTENIFDVHDRSFLYGAPELIIVSTTGNDNVSFSNAAIITHNMALEAVELEVGACYIWACMIALTHNQELIKELEIPDGFMPSAAIAIGISDEKYTDREIEEGRISVNYI